MTANALSRADPSSGMGLGRSLVAIALFAAVVGSVGAPLITPVATTMHVSLDAAQWTLTVALLTGAIAGPVLGRLGSGPHRRATILVTLALATLGGALTTAPLPFVALLAGRALQGLGLGVIALLMSVSRDRLPAEQSNSTIATIAVASTVAIGVGYPLVGLVDQVAGLRAAYGLGFLLSMVALIIAWRSIGYDEPRPPTRVDLRGALFLGVGVLGVLVTIADPTVWSDPRVGTVIVVIAACVLATWVFLELRAASPLVDLRMLGQTRVFRANAAMLVAGIGMYLLFSLLTRYVQTPSTANYGFDLPGVLSGAALIPFSVLGFVAGRIAPSAVRRLSARMVYTVAAVAVTFASLLFVAAPGSLGVVLAAMAVLGFGVGGVSAVMPQLVLADVPKTETASVLSINQLVRSIGFTIGSALAGLLLAAATPPDTLLPTARGYQAASLWVLPLVALSAVVLLCPWRRVSL